MIDCAEMLGRLRRDDVLKVGRSWFKVEKAQGTLVYVIRNGTKGTKLYRLLTISLDPAIVNVVEVWPGSGDYKTDVGSIATGRCDGDPLLWKQITISA